MSDGEEDSRGPDGPGEDAVRVVVIGADGAAGDGGDRTELVVERGRPLRDVLLEADRSPYATATERLNCGGRGICATCGVRIRKGPAPSHWHDRLADRFGYPRLSCQVVVDRPMTVELVDKRVWGGREPAPR
ncbi:2Fe-2S iron-sulfur cluster-binding protein [Halorubrum halodurans]|uniref:(2Fe-2S)-binding protein n=1 Tax=Halorubrum halodurans TaxID=1383851 RepID=A0A256IIJ2_9EURY|nr:2Fe-2S iron-sulfur cluster-binding protein [Halorubrum halodurans]OYR56371.1 (2Fe-2S)-binding protein [Halorubrum halodurans]